MLLSSRVKDLIWALLRGKLHLLYANNKDADQPAHPRSLINAFIIRFLERTIAKPASCNVSRFWLVYVAGQATLFLKDLFFQII